MGDRKIRTLNRRYLGRDYPTDVIAFSHTEQAASPRICESVPFLGDIAISLDTAKKQATRFRSPFRHEMALYLCHGILHLMGYRDKTKKEAARMERQQKRILKKIGIR